MGPFGITIESPGVTRERDAAPGGAFGVGAHFGPALHLIEAAATTLAHRVPLAGRTNRNARRIGRGVVPGQPGLQRFFRKALHGHLVLVVKHHQRVNFGQGPQFSRQGHAIRGGVFVAPVVDGRLDVADVNRLHGASIIALWGGVAWRSGILVT